VLIDFRAEWCIPCLDLERKTFSDPRVAALLGESFVALRFDVTNQDERTGALMQAYRVEGLPAVLMLTADRHELARVRTFVTADELLPTLQAARDELPPAPRTGSGAQSP